MNNTNFFNSIIQPKWIIKRAKKNKELRRLDNISKLLNNVKSQMKKHFPELYANSKLNFKHFDIFIKEQEELINAKYK